MVIDREEQLASLDRRVDTDAVLPAEFYCPACELWYNDGPPLILVRRWNGEEIAICTDVCGEKSGFVDAVIARQRAQARGDAICILYSEA